MRPDDTTLTPSAEDVEFWRREIAWRRQALTTRGLPLDTAQELHFEIDVRLSAIRRSEAKAMAPPLPRFRERLTVSSGAKLTADQVREIRRRAADEKQVDLAREFRVGKSTIKRVLTRESYADVEDRA